MWSKFNLYNMTLQRPSCVNCAVHGAFSGTKQQEIVVARGSILELLRPDPNTGKVHTLLSHEMFAVIRTMIAFRLTGATKDYVVLGADTGRLVVLEYDPQKNCFNRIHQETFGKTGCRRIVPGQYLAVDTKGRAIMTAAIEKQKLVYIMNRDAQARLTISSPLEAHKSYSVCFATTNVDVGFENPMFACLEMDYEELDQDVNNEIEKTDQMLVWYELDLGLNHVVRKHAESLPTPANHLICVPGGNDGPSGVLVCGTNYILFKNLGDQPDIRVSIPRRRVCWQSAHGRLYANAQNDLDNTGHGVIVVCSATHRTRSMFFFLVQTEQGDVFKVTLDVDDGLVTEMKIKYFDTLPVANSLCILKTGFLFVASEFGNHHLYQIARLGDDDDEPEFSSRMPHSEETGETTFFFAPRALTNLVKVDELESLAPILASNMIDLAGEDAPQLYVACGRGPLSTMRCLRHGLEVTEMAISELPGSPTAVWTVKKHSDDEFDAYIIVSFVNATLVLSIGETVEEVTDSGFLGTTPTITCGLIGDDALIQVYPEGIRHIRADRRVNEWKAPGRRHIVKCTTNNKQVVIALNGGELVYFELDPTGQLNEYTERRDLSSEVVCMSLGEVPSGEQRSRLLAIGLADRTVRIISLDVTDCLNPLSMQALPAQAESVLVLEMGADDTAQRSSLFLNIGLENGVLLRTVIDAVSGDLSDTRTRYLGTKPVKLFKAKMQGRNSVLAMSSRSWLLYFHQNRFHLTPLSYEPLEHSSSFSSEQCPEGVVAIAANTLRILALEKLGVVFNQMAHPLAKTPRKMIIHPQSGNFILLETDHNTYTRESARAQKKLIAEEMVELAAEDEQELAAEMAAQFLQDDLPEETFGVAKAGAGMWSSIIRIVHPISGKTLQMVELPQNEAAFSCALVQFANQPGATFVLVGVVSRLRLRPRSLVGGFLYTYLLSSAGDRMDFVHRTPVEEAIPDIIVNIEVMGQRIFCSDVHESVHFVRYKQAENQLITFADDIIPRHVHTTCLLDYDTIAVADKFGSISILRLPKGTIDEVQEDPTGVRSLWDKGGMGGASQKAECVSCIYIGDMVTTLQKTTLIPGGSDALVYCTISGGVGTLVPLTSKDDVEFFSHLEMHLRSHLPPLSGRDHLSYRSAFQPVKAIVDGDLCEQFNLLPLDKQKQISEDLDRQPSEVAKKLEDIRTRYAF